MAAAGACGTPACAGTLRPDVAFGVEGTRSEPANNDAPEHGLAFRATLRW